MKRVILLLLASLFVSTTVMSKCVEIDPKNITINWKAFKTPLKIGVGGKFEKFSLDGKASGTSIRDVAYGMGIDISTNSISTGNKARDGKIHKFFFQTAKGGGTIKARITEIKEKTLVLKVTMNGKTQDVHMSYSVHSNEFKANGILDILDFSMGKSLRSINKACYALHEGKTWSDVELELIAEFGSCKG